jgi:hypothetical protein
MIGFLDTFTLARAKLRSKKVLLIITIVLSGLLFGVLITGITVVSDLVDSATSYTKSALNGRYLVATQPVIPNELYGVGVRVAQTPSDELQAKLQKIEQDYIDEQKALADEYDVPFNEDTVVHVLIPDPYGQKDATGKVRTILNPQSPAWNIYLDELQNDWARTTPSTFNDLENLAKKYGATNVYRTESASLSYTTATYLHDGKEDLTKLGQSNGGSAYMLDQYAAAVRNSDYNFADEATIQRFILPENDKRQQHKDAIPVVMTTDEAITLFGNKLGISNRPMGATEQITWMKDFQSKINGQTYQVCYRSLPEMQLIAQQRLDNGQLEINKDNKDYIEPSLQYNLPTTPCGVLTIKKDTRTDNEKALSEKQKAYQKALGTYQPLERQLLTFQIVGVMQQTSFNVTLNANLQNLANSLLGAQYNGGAFIVSDLYNKLPEDARHENILRNSSVSADMSRTGLGNGQAFIKADIVPAIVSFPSVDKARKFIEQAGCGNMYSSSNNCDNKPFFANTYGSNYLVVDDIGKLAATIASVAFPIALILAGIIILITMARVIIDSRHETAVFRALGAKRRDIMAVYITYSLMVAGLIALFALALGFIGAFIIESLYVADLTHYAQVAYGVFTSSQSFSFIGVNLSLLGLVVASIIVVSVIAVLPPLIRNVRRNPIRDMRDDG